MKGNAAEQSLERASITCNKNGVPFDSETAVTSGIRLGIARLHYPRLRRGRVLQAVGHLVSDVLDGLARDDEDNAAAEAKVRAQVQDLRERFPIYG